ncbi:hypothetical protein QJS04_geneDACA001679 [Acorus gramineus]|uniref:RRM domain-containing protein n=1 Tax=Acorus gramineus TaxID=55184 RepID=A0AAV9BLU9_ACOGR|nr:hypothetical protein QJS04_geneDACA001679 [Acorus gramineus]
MAEPSKVIHIRNVGHEISENDLLQLVQPFGVVTKLVMLRAKNQALLQMHDVGSAVNALQYYSNVQPSVSLTELQVNYNNERSRDFTNPSLPSEQKGRSSQPGYGDASGMYALQPGGRAVAFPQMGNPAAIAAAFGGGLPPGITGTNDRCTILVSNLNPDKIDEDKLFNLFSIYGNIIRVKLLRNKPDHALIQMGDGFQAELAVHFLKGAMLFGKRMEVNYSKHVNITAGPDTHEYSGSSLNRFNRNAAKNYRYCCSPTKMVHLSTLPQEITEEEIATHLEEHGTIVNTKLFEVNGKKQALVLFENEEQATEALVCKHATTIDRSIIRISFSQLQTI